jgi:hypothetical protein
VSARRVYDLPLVSLGLGASAGLAWLHQSFDTAGSAPPRDSAAGQLGVLVDSSLDLTGGLYLLAELAGQLHVVRHQSSSATGANSAALTAVFAWRPFLGLGKHF